MTASAWARTARRTSRSSIWRSLRAMPESLRVPPGRCGGDGRMLGAGADGAADGPRCWRCRGRTCPRCAPMPARTAARAAATCWPKRRRRAGATLIATGSEVRSALDARELLEAEGIGTAVVSMPCWELFAAQDAAYRDQVLRQLRCASASRPRSASAGNAGSAPMASSSAWTASAPRPRPRISTGISASPPRRSRRRSKKRVA